LFKVRGRTAIDTSFTTTTTLSDTPLKKAVVPWPRTDVERVVASQDFDVGRGAEACLRRHWNMDRTHPYMRSLDQRKDDGHLSVRLR
jgi:hypothetical protein